MRSMRLIASTLVAICLLVVPPAWSQGGNPPASTKEKSRGMTAAEQTGKSDETAKQEIKTLQGQLVKAILKSDTSFFEKYYDDDYAEIHGDGKLTTKTQEIENFKSGVTKHESIDVREAKIRTYGDTVIVNALASVKTTVNGNPYSGDVRATRVWVKQKGDWKIVTAQHTRVASASQ
ncbi:MAG: nuclear transport factor 2 family protein [Terriglobales bacterium]